MKILLICFPRTGSTSIIEYYKYSNPDIKTFSEPFNKNGREGYFTYNHIIQYENVFVKHIYDQLPPDLKNISINEINEIYYKFAPAFTHIGLWCNGNTTVFGAVFLGSSPSRPTKKLFK